ncbi:MAG: Purine ribonucleoside efflux pump NepI [Herbaspirillum frisingense]|uniref:Purine ribonucleoside efflux pump NepI n=1 Tax=Herbaspirillum frisingense TaxID=92645 RepID=A0A7V8FZX8_9BURK|nr:MAG: Purine ribonucleoside efflux pump NepI [Herbaspirillum frisingense]
MMEQPGSIPAVPPPSAAARLPVAALLALAMASFIATANETAPAGLLPQIARDFGIPEAGAGQLVTCCALGSGLAAIPLTAASAGWRRRGVLLAALATFLVGNVVTAFSPGYALTLAARFAIGLATGVAWSLLAGYARRMAPAAQQGRALALAMAGIPMALALGMPLASWFGALAGWRSVFSGLALMSAVLCCWVWIAVPDFPGEAAGARPRIGQVLALPGIRAILAVIMLWILAHYMLYTYIAPFLAQLGLAGLLERMLLVFGLSAMAGNWLAGALIDRRLRGLALAYLGAFAAVALMFGLGAARPALVYAGVAAWGISFGGAPTLLQTALADAAGEHADAAQAMLVTSFNLAFAGSGALGGVLLQTAGAGAIPRVLVALLMAACWIVWRSDKHGFPAGHRRAREQ